MITFPKNIKMQHEIQHKEKEASFLRLLSMQEKRLELSWYCYHTDLNRARLPIPPFLRTNISISAFLLSVNSFLKISPKYFVRYFPPAFRTRNE